MTFVNGVYLVGAPGVGARSVTSTVTGAYSQPPKAGNTLVAIVIGGSSTTTSSAAFTQASGSTFTTGGVFTTNLSGGAGFVRCEYWTRVATGGETVPVFNVMASGPAGAIVVIFELFNPNAAPLDVSGLYNTGSSAITIASLAPATSGSVAAANEFAIAAYGFVTASVTTTYTWTKGGAWTHAYDDGSAGSRVRMAVDYLPNPSSGSACSESASITSFSGYGAGIILVVKQAASISYPLGQISPVGIPTVASATALSSIGYTPQNAGDLLLVTTKIANSAITCTGVSATGTTGWQRIAGPFADNQGTPHNQDMWIGTVTVPNTVTTLNFTFSSSVASTIVDLCVQEFTTGYTTSTWTQDGASASVNNVSSTSIGFPALTAAKAGELYVGRSRIPAGGYYTNISAGFVCARDANNNPFVYNVNAGSGSVSATATDSVAAVSSSLSALIQWAGVVLSLAGSSAAASTGSGNLGTLSTLAGTSVTVSSAAGTISAILLVAGSSVTASAGSGTLYSTGVLSGSSATVSAGSGTLYGLLRIAGSSVTASAGSGTLYSTGVLSGSSATVSAGSGALLTAFSVAGSSATASSAAGALVSIGVLSGTSVTVSSANGTITGTGTLILTGSSATASAGSGTVALYGILSGTSVTASSAAGTLWISGGMTGTSATVSSGSGTLVLLGLLSGTSATASHANGTMILIGLLSGASVTASAGSGTLTGAITISGTSVTVSAGNGALGLSTFINGASATVSVCSGALIAGTITVNGMSVTASAGGGWILPLIFVPPSGASQDYVWVEILDSNLVRQGVIQFATLTAQLYYNAVGSWSMTVPYSDFLWNLIMSGDFFVNINWRGLFSFGGKCEQPGYSDSIPGASGSGSATGPYITLSGATYEGLLANRIVYPTPAAAWSAQTAAGTDAVSATPLETAIKHYVNNNIGPGALASRRVSSLSLATDQHRGANVSYTAKFVQGGDLNLLDVIRGLIAQSGSGNAMGVSITRNASAHSLVFDCYVPRNLSGLAWFSRDLGNLTAVSFSLTDPTCTDALVQGSGTNFIQQTAAGKTQYNQVELFSDSSGETDVNNLKTTASAAVLSGAAGPTMSAVLADTPYLTFGRDYRLGDIVTVEVRPGNFYSDVITGVTLTADPTQTPMINVVPTVGQNANATATDQTIIGQLTNRIRTLERRLRILW